MKTIITTNGKENIIKNLLKVARGFNFFQNGSVECAEELIEWQGYTLEVNYDIGAEYTQDWSNGEWDLIDGTGEHRINDIGIYDEEGDKVELTLKEQTDIEDNLKYILKELI